MKIHCKLTFENLHKFQERGIIFIVLWFVLINYFLFSRTCSVSGATYLLTTASVRWVACLLGIPFFRSKSDKRAPDYNEQIILVPSQHPIIHNNVKLLCYNEHPVTTSTQCTTAVLKCFQGKKNVSSWKNRIAHQGTYQSDYYLSEYEKLATTHNAHKFSFQPFSLPF